MELMTLPPSPSKTEWNFTNGGQMVKIGRQYMLHNVPNKGGLTMSSFDMTDAILDEIDFTQEISNSTPLTKKKETALERKSEVFVMWGMWSDEERWKKLNKLEETARQEAVKQRDEEIKQIISDDDEGYINEEVRHARNRMKHSLITQLTHK
jgi:hypothetical protein